MRRKLTEMQANSIRQRLDAGESTRKLSNEFGVSRAIIQDIKRGQTYRMDFQESSTAKRVLLSFTMPDGFVYAWYPSHPYAAQLMQLPEPKRWAMHRFISDYDMTYQQALDEYIKDPVLHDKMKDEADASYLASKAFREKQKAPKPEMYGPPISLRPLTPEQQAERDERDRQEEIEAQLLDQEYAIKLKIDALGGFPIDKKTGLFREDIVSLLLDQIEIRGSPHQAYQALVTFLTERGRTDDIPRLDALVQKREDGRQYKLDLWGGKDE